MDTIQYPPKEAPMKLQMTVRVVDIHAYDDGVLGHGLTHRVTLLSCRADGTIQSTLEMTTARQTRDDTRCGRRVPAIR